MIVTESFMRSLIKIYGKHLFIVMVGGTWYSEACISLRLEHRLHSPSSYEENSIVVERTIEYLKDRTEIFDDYYYPCRKAGLCNLRHVQKCLTLFVFMHNSIVKSSRSKFDNMMRWMMHLS